MEKLVKREDIFKGKLLTLHVDTVRMPDGYETKREVIEHPGAAVIVAIDGKEQVLLVRQYRHAIGREMLELPAGTREKDEPAEQTAPRELQEETGYTARNWEPLAHFFSSPGILTEEMFIFLARDLAEGASKTESDEKIQVVKVPLHEAVEMAQRGEITDAKSIIGLLLAKRKLDTMATP
jgi:ADP-ribose pyrophosphatase